MNHLRFLHLLAEITSVRGEKAAFVAALQIFQKTVMGHYYSVLYGRVGCASVDVFHPGEGWMGIDSEIARTIARHHLSHPFSIDFFAKAQAAVYWRSQMVDEAEWRRTDIYRFLDCHLGIEDMIGMYFPLPTGQFGGLFCGSKTLLTKEDFSNAQELHQVLVALFAQVAEDIMGDEESASVSLALSVREQSVMGWLAQGKSNQDIGIILGISPHTVRKHLENIFRKLGVDNRTAAVREFRERPKNREKARADKASPAALDGHPNRLA